MKELTLCEKVLILAAFTSVGACTALGITANIKDYYHKKHSPQKEKPIKIETLPTEEAYRKIGKGFIYDV